MQMYNELNDALINNENPNGPHSVGDLSESIYKDINVENFYKVIDQ